MRWCTRRRSRTVCLSLVVASLSLHLLLIILSRSVYQNHCDAPSPRQTHLHTLRALVDTNYTSRMLDNHASYAKTPPDTRKVNSSHMDSNGPQKMSEKDAVTTKMAVKVGHGHKEEGPVDTHTMTVRVGKFGSMGIKPMGSGMSKLEALFSHPLYNMPTPPIHEDDWLLKVKPKGKARETSTQMWVSYSDIGDDSAHWNRSSDSHPPWLRFHLGISRWQLYPHLDPNMAPLAQQLSTHRIVSAVQKSGGTQLKLVMSFPNYGQAILKPMKQERDEETNFNLYYFSDFERHNAEIAAFHLDRVLGYRRIPPAVGRLVDVVTEIKDITTDHKLARTFFTSPVNNVCFYGQCSYYCSTEHAVCGRPQNLEASLAMMLPDTSLATRRSWRSPWKRSYSRSKLAVWEKDPDYCDTVKKTPPYNKGTRLVDLIDMTILDFLMGNMDRHHYETFEKFGNNTFLLHLDNGRAFGRHSTDEPSILTPLEQCCRIRRSTLLHLRLLSLPQYRLSDVMRDSLSHDPLFSVAPLLSELHLSALDRRLVTVLQTVSRCQERQRSRHGEGDDDVIYDDVTDYKTLVKHVTPAG
ncbi:extracellular serine/threonine protein kinase FAM20C [Oncorhynchus kisutch]|uniref:extracellular serine/threonine protein kinase FAM20C-like n=1 Tax=Oncorhynchus kisutch TaxID=8019 RepID=UPI0012DFCF8F|nr:extracellular serine/threonine protein kinase FAM20C-like [Oncorhynchus kisutch]XP_031675041.1 extracellular serine/threonine protein kinase FAM20C-like [Oncorhynchus kisutch]